MNGASPSNRRRFQRLTFEQECFLLRSTDILPAQTENISEGGLFVVVNQLCSVGSLIEVVIPLAGNEHRIQCRVSWRRPLTSASPGMGLAFSAPSPTLVTAIRDIRAGLIFAHDTQQDPREVDHNLSGTLRRFTRGYQVVHTNRSAYHIRLGVCIGVKSLRSEGWRQEHPATGRALRGCALSRDKQVNNPVVGGFLRFDSETGKPLYSSRVLELREPTWDEAAESYVRHVMERPLDEEFANANISEYAFGQPIPTSTNLSVPEKAPALPDLPPPPLSMRQEHDIPLGAATLLVPEFPDVRGEHRGIIELGSEHTSAKRERRSHRQKLPPSLSRHRPQEKKQKLMPGGAQPERANAAERGWFLLQFIELKQADYFRLLGIKRGAGELEIHQAYQHRRQQFDPERYVSDSQDTVTEDFESKARELMRRVEVAFETLSHPERKASYLKRLPRR